MTISMTSIFTSALLAFILFGVLLVILKMNNKSSVINSKILFTVICLIILTLCLPVEFHFTTTLKSTILFPFFQRLLSQTIINSNYVTFTLGNLLLWIWFIGSVYKLIGIAQQSIGLRRLQKLYTCVESRQYQNVEIRIVEEIQSPMLTGLFKPTILLPNRLFSEQELSFIVSHELIHVNNHDLLLKYFFEIVLAIYWWIPYIYILRKQLNQVLELRVDEQITATFHEQQKIHYIETLLKIAKETTTQPAYPALEVRFLPEQKQIVHRSKMILHNQVSTNFTSLIIIGLISIWFVFSLFTIEPYSVDNDTAETTFEITPENSFLIRTDSGYDLYYNDSFLLDIPDLDGSPDFKKLKKYDSLEEVK